MVVVQRRHPFADGETVDILHFNVGTFFYRTEMFAKLSKIARIIAQGVRAHISLVREMFEELVDLVLKHTARGHSCPHEHEVRTDFPPRAAVRTRVSALPLPLWNIVTFPRPHIHVRTVFDGEGDLAKFAALFGLRVRVVAEDILLRKLGRDLAEGLVELSL